MIDASSGFNVHVEYPRGSLRFGKRMRCDYGHVLSSAIGHDGEAVDCFVRLDPNPRSSVHVVSQVDPETGEFDEHKVMLGFDSRDEACDMYCRQVDDPRRMGSVKTMSRKRFQAWLSAGARSWSASEGKTCDKSRGWYPGKNGKCVRKSQTTQGKLKKEVDDAKRAVKEGAKKVVKEGAKKVRGAAKQGAKKVQSVVNNATRRAVKSLLNSKSVTKATSIWGKVRDAAKGAANIVGAMRNAGHNFADRPATKLAIGGMLRAGRITKLVAQHIWESGRE